MFQPSLKEIDKAIPSKHRKTSPFLAILDAMEQLEINAMTVAASQDAVLFCLF